jgi:hypothetical protein
MVKKVKDVVPTLYKVTLNITEDVLGSSPSDPQIYTKFVASRALQAEKKLAVSDEEMATVQAKQDAITEEELAMLPEEQTMKGLTIFRRRPADGALILVDTQIRGYLKEAANAMGADGETWGLTSKIDKYVFITGSDRRPIRMIPLLRDGQIVTKPDSIYERPLRAMTRLGPRITLAASELILAPVSLDFYICLVGLGELKSGKPITEEILASWVSYGMYQGLSQYRTGGYGRFDAIVTAATV